MFWLGVHRPNWLGLTDVPLFVSRRTMMRQKSWTRALGPWALDSGGFTELSLHGTWTVSPRQYISDVHRLQHEVGNLAWAAPQDWMCEPFMLTRTGKTVAQHQALTVENFLRLAESSAPFVPVLQGWTMDDYRRHADAYAAAGVDLRRFPVVGIGSVCRRQASTEAANIVRGVQEHVPGIQLHGFGFKKLGLRKCTLASADSMAWSVRARRSPPINGHPHRNCANCLRFALQWRAELLAQATTETH